MRIAGIRKTSLVDNVGVNYVIFVQGCPHKCEECHNPSTHNPNGGYEVILEELQTDILSLKLIQGITFSGGEPVDQMSEVKELAKWCKDQGLQTTLYTGYNLTKMGDGGYYWTSGYDVIKTAFPIKCFDFIIDGLFECDKKSLDLPFRGSSNQRILQRGIDY